MKISYIMIKGSNVIMLKQMTKYCGKLNYDSKKNIDLEAFS